MNLTKPQKLIYDMENFSGGAIAVVCGVMLIRGKKEPSEIKKAANELYRLNDALRIRIRETDTAVLQSVCEYNEQEFPTLFFDNKAALDSYSEDYAKIPFDFYGNLCEFNIVILPDQYGLLVKLHHVISDAWTLSLLGTQFYKLMNNEEVNAYSYIDYIETESAYLQSNRYEKDKTFFIEQFKKCDEVTYLSEKQSKSQKTYRQSFVIDKAQTRLISDYVQQKNASAFMLFTTALSTYISRTRANTERFYIGTAVLNRSGTKEKNTLGMFVNTVPMLIEPDYSKSFADNLSAIKSTALSIFRHQKFNYGDVLSAIRQEFGFTEKLYDVLISYQNATINGTNIETTWYPCGSQNESLQIHIDDRDNEGIFRIHYDYLADKFTESDIAKMHEHICNLLFDAVADDTKKLHELNILSLGEKQKLLYEFNNTAVDYPKDKCVHQLFEEHAKKTPDKVAVIACDKTLTYAQLNEQANRIAHSLIKKGIGTGDKVIYSLTRKSYLLSSVLGILKSGAAYIPVAPDYPKDRIEYMYNDSCAKFCITEDNIADLLSHTDSHNPCTAVSPQDLCYCIYTSGSTGNPKGVMIQHQNVVNYVSENSYNVVNINFSHQAQTIAAIDTCGFDIFVTESLLPICNGFTVIFADEMQSKNPKDFAELMRRHPADIIQTTPTKLKILISDDPYNDVLTHFQSIIVGGEALELSFLKELRKKTNARIYNNYGPTETTVWSSLTEITSDDIHIGKPIANTQIYIVDNYLNLTPIGVIGELCIAGDGVGAGYLNRPELTAEKFIDNPFGEGKLYKTGDLAYWREDGNIAYVGRNDFQVKIRGLRIELGEIENTIGSIDGISQAVTVVRKSNDGRQLICAFYTGEEIPATDIRAHIGKKLPKYMLPHVCMHINELPMTASGKINRKALPEIDFTKIISNAASYVAPETPMQKALCSIAATILGVHSVSLTDDFFDLGGDSLKAIEFVSKSHNEGIYFNLQNVFDCPTVKQLCEALSSENEQAVSFDDVDFSNLHRLLEKNTIEHITVPQPHKIGNILLAGATGYLGIHILADYLDNDSGIAYCLVRGKDNADSTTRLQELLTFYFGDKYNATNRIEVICADLQKDKFGLSREQYEFLLDHVDTVFNCAATVKHYGSYRYFYEANVETANRLIAFCRDADAVLIHTSTMSVSGNSFGDDFGGNIHTDEIHFAENNLYIGQPLDNVYARSKFESEKAVLESITTGLRANIMRLGQLTNRVSDGVFQKNYESNAYLKRLKAMLDMNVLPENLADQYTEFTPIDKAAEAIMTIARHFNQDQTVFHIENHKFILMRELAAMFSSLGYPVKLISQTEFAALIKETADDPNKKYILESFINEIDENNRLSYESNIHIDMEFTVAYLKALGFEWPSIDTTYLQNYLSYFKKIGYLQ